MTTRRRDGNTGTPFSEWTRNNPNLDSRYFGLTMTDIDHWVVHKYKEHRDRCGDRTLQDLMIVEEKSNGAKMTETQKDTLTIIHQLIRCGRKERRKVWSPMLGRYIQARFWGLFCLRYSGLTIPASDEIFWDNRIVSRETLEQICRFELNPRTLENYDPRRHHTAKKYVLGDMIGFSAEDVADNGVLIESA